MSHFGATILDADGLDLSVDEKAFFRDADPFGFILFARNIDTPDQVRALCAELRDAVGRDALITVDQEGGRVQRLRAPHWREYLPPLEQTQRAGDNAARAMYLRFRLIAAELRDVGIDSNCAPMADLARPETHPFLRNRCYGEDAAQVAQIARAAADGLLAGGVVPVVKHMPGHGRATLDSHKELPHVSTDRSTLEAEDFAVFAALSDLPMGMTAHIVFEDIDTAPATTSPEMMQLIRNQIGFQGLIMTDDISMEALSGSPAQRAAASLAAGCDIALYCNAPLADRIAVAEAAGQMDDAGQVRALAALETRRTPETVDIADLDAQLGALLNGQGDD